MNTMNRLWKHQKAAVNAANDAIRTGRPSGLWAMPTGTGKTRAFFSLAAELRWPTLVMMHRDELIRQTVGAFSQAWPEAKVGVVQGDRDEWGDDVDVVVASVPSLHARRLDKMPVDRFGLVVADEAHHAVAQTWAAVLDHFESRFVLGCTATPERTDRKGLAERFGKQPIYSYALRQAIEDRRLVRLTQYAIRTTVDLGDVTFRTGDFADGELSEVVNTSARNDVIVEAYQEHGGNRRAIVFAVDLAHVRDLTKAFRDAGIFATSITGETAKIDRRQLLEEFANGQIQVMVNCAVLTEGFDDPGIGCVLMARPTASRSLYQQCIGRGLRLDPGKVDCQVLDFVDNSSRHKLVTVLDLLGAPKISNANGGDVIEAVDEDRAEAERQHLIESTQPLAWRLEKVCPWPELPNLNGYGPTIGWHGNPASEKQVAYLRRFGLDVSRRLTRGEASFLIDRCREYSAAFPEPATGKQKWVLRRAGLWQEGMGIREASVAIGKLKSGQLVGAGA